MKIVSILASGLFVGCLAGLSPLASPLRAPAQEDSTPSSARDAASAKPPMIDLGGVSLKVPDRHVEISTGGLGDRVTLTDRQTGNSVTIDTSDFALILGETNKVLIAGDEFTFRRGEHSIAVVNRRADTRQAPTSPHSADRAPAQLRQFEIPTPQVGAVALSPDGRLAVSGGSDGAVHIWDAATGHLIHTNKGGSRVRAMAFTADGSRLYFGTSGGVVQVFDVERKAIVLGFGGGSGEVRALAVAGDGKRLLVAGARRVVQLWDLETQKLLRSDPQPMDSLTCVAFLPGNDSALCAGAYHGNSQTPLDALVRIWSLESGNETFRIPAPARTVIHAVAPLPKRGWIVVPDPKSDQLAIWDVTTREVVRSFASVDFVGDLAVSGDGRRIVAVSTSKVSVWDASTGENVASLDLDRGLYKIAISHDGSSILVGGSDGAIRLWRNFTPVPR